MVVGLFVIFAIGAAVMWTTPQKRGLNLVWGFLHGPIYDDWIGLDAGIIIGRLSHLFLAILLLLLAWFKDRTAHISACIIVAGAWFVTSVTASWSPSVGAGAEKLNHSLQLSLPGEGFTLRWAASEKVSVSDDKIIPISIQRLHRDISFHIIELGEILKEPKLPYVTVYAYPDNDSKKLWFGGGATDVADIYTPSIHITLGEWPHPTLRHELAHALTSGFAFHGIGFHPNMAFTEGLAVALAPNERSMSLHESAASLLATGRVKSVEDLFSASGFWKESGGRAYSVAGSLIQYLIDTKGIASVKLLYAGKSWQDALGEAQNTTLARWQNFIKNSYNSKTEGIQAEALYRYPGILKDQCPHGKADLRRARSDGLLTRLRQPVGWDSDDDYLGWLLTLDPKDIETRLAIWKAETKKIAEEHVPVPEKILSWRNTVGQSRSWPPKTLEDIDLAILESDLRRVEGDKIGSSQILNELLTFASSTTVGDSLLRQIGARLEIENKVADPFALEWRKYLAGWRRVLPEARADEPWLITYLRMRRAPITEMADPGMLRILADAPADDSMGSTKAAFQFEWDRLIATRMFNIQAYSDAENIFKKMAESAKPGRKEILLEHQRRAAFYAKLPPLIESKNKSKNN